MHAYSAGTDGETGFHCKNNDPGTLGDIAHNRLVLISRKLGISIQEVQRISDVIRSLEPKPGRKFAGSREIRYIKPDVIVKEWEMIIIYRFRNIQHRDCV